MEDKDYKDVDSSTTSNKTRDSVISWLISVIVDARSQLECAKSDKSKGDDNDVLK